MVILKPGADTAEIHNIIKAQTQAINVVTCIAEKDLQETMRVQELQTLETALQTRNIPLITLVGDTSLLSGVFHHLNPAATFECSTKGLEPQFLQVHPITWSGKMMTLQDLQHADIACE